MGTSFANQLPTSQRKEFLQEEKITVHKGGKEGSSIFSSYHHPNRLKEIFEKTGFVIKEHKVGKEKSWGIEQDFWVLQK